MYNVYVLCEGAVDEEQSFDSYDDATTYYLGLLESLKVEAKNEQIELSVHMYDTFENRIVREATITTEGKVF